MRSLFVLFIVFGMVPVILRYPQVGVLMWSWISFMSPHKMTYGAAQTFHVADVIAAATLIAMILSSKERKLPVMHSLIVLIAIYAIWTTITTIVSVNPVDAWEKWAQAEKILLFTFVTAVVMVSRNRIWALVWTIAICIGFFGIKGGIFTVLGGGVSHVFGPPGSFIGANNGIAVAFNMVIPLFRFLQINTESKIIRMMLTGSMALTAIAVLGTQSRAGMLGLAAMLIYFLLKSRKRLFAIALGAAALVAAFVIMPGEWMGRMESISNYQDDGSAQGRLQMWKYAIDVAAERPIVGGGFEINSHQPTFDRLLPEGVEGRAAHSSYFEVLGEHGYVGLLLFLTIGFWTFSTGGKIVRRVRGHSDLQWAGDLAAMLQVGLVGYAVNTAFVNFAIFDLYWQFVAIMAVTAVLVEKTIASSDRSAAAGAPDKRFSPFPATAGELTRQSLHKF